MLPFGVISRITWLNRWRTGSSPSNIEAFLSDVRQPEVTRFLFNMLWRCQVWNPKRVFSHSDNVSEILGKTIAQEYKRSTYGLRATLKNVRVA